MEATKAFRVEVCDDPSTAGIYMAETASKARYQAYLAALDVGYPVKLPDLRVRRAPEYDGLKVHGFAIEYAEMVRVLTHPTDRSESDGA